MPPMENPMPGVPQRVLEYRVQDRQFAPDVSAIAPWSVGLCDCCSDFGRFTWCCPCYTFGQVSEIVDRGSSSCGMNGAIYCLLSWFTGCACCNSFVYRMKLRKQFNLKGSEGQDFLYHCCCETYALTQVYRELQNRWFDVSLGWIGNVERKNRGVAMAPVVEPAMNH